MKMNTNNNKNVPELFSYSIRQSLPEKTGIQFIDRVAVRAIIHQNTRLLMIYSQKTKDVKFPGGGVNDEENYIDALRREVLEETGHRINNIAYAGEINELRVSNSSSFTYLRMKSLYYYCESTGEITTTNYDEYEKDFNYVVEFIEIEDAIFRNEQVVTDKRIPWCERELIVLRFLKDFQQQKVQTQ